jgi:hypothetical protein
MSGRRWRALAGRSRVMIVILVGLGCVAAPSAAFGSASVRGCVNTIGQSAISGASVALTPVNGTPGGGNSGQTDGTGCTAYMTVPAGQYDISYHATHYEDQWYSHASSQASASPVTVSDGQQYSYTAALDHKPEVTGAVVDVNTGEPLAGWKVEFYSPTLQANGVSGYGTYTASDGTYVVDFDNDPSTGFGPGDYTACVGDVSNDGNMWMPTCSGGAPTKETATPIHVSASTITSNVDFSVSRAGAISGTTYIPGGLTDNNTNMTISAYDAGGHVLASTMGDGDGGYWLEAPIGTDYVSFAQPGYATQYSNAKGGLGCADPVTVAWNGTTQHIDAHMTADPLAPCSGTGGGSSTGGGGSTGGGTGAGGSGGTGGGTGGTGGPAGIGGPAGTGQGTPGAPGHQTVVLGSGGAGQVHVSCSSTGPCSGSLQISVGVLAGRAVAAAGKHPARVVIGSATFRKLAAGRTSSVSFRLNRAGIRLLGKSRRRLKATLAISFTSGGRTTTVHSAIVLRRR